MTVGELIVVLLAVVLTASVVGWFLLNRKHPEAASEPGSGRDAAGGFFGDPDDRPGSPGAEDDGVAAPGEPAPGPSAETTEPR